MNTNKAFAAQERGEAIGGIVSYIRELEAERDALVESLALLDAGYETGRNSDIESEEVAAIYKVTGSVNDREFEQVSIGRTVREALAALLLKETDK